MIKYRLSQVSIIIALVITSCNNNKPADSPESQGNVISTIPYSVRARILKKVKTPLSAPISASQSDTLIFTTQLGFSAYDAILHKDTLLVVSSSRDILYPFGQVTHAVNIKQRYPQFSLAQGAEKINGLTYPYTILSYKYSTLKFYDNDEDGATIVAGHIADPEIILQNHIHIGMSLVQVIQTFFSSIDQVKLQHLRVLRIDSGIAGIKYFYNFEGNTLRSIVLDSYSIMSRKL